MGRVIDIDTRDRSSFLSGSSSRPVHSSERWPGYEVTDRSVLAMHVTQKGSIELAYGIPEGIDPEFRVGQGLEERERHAQQ